MFVFWWTIPLYLAVFTFVGADLQEGTAAADPQPAQPVVEVVAAQSAAGNHPFADVD